MSRHGWQLIFLLLAVSAACLALQFEPLASFANWQAELIPQGQWLRILTGNFTHTNFNHLAMNIAALWIITFIFKPSARSLLALLVLVSLGVGIGILYTDIQSYVGLSGTLHGLFAYYALREALQGRKSSWLLVVGVIAKVAWELTQGPSASTAALINARVAIEAHLCGTVSGILFAFISYPVYKNAR
ncbi:rhombosortase [Vibrio sp. LaRot3]|uniref:rhombosortase n=1 Tax=Vibrio sp. LaRot3 TaxID=2998829 RepID=UPI0022CDD434|nr:rhombosortase [Vibrio sp. LaRot3]